MLGRIYAIALNTFREAVRSKVLYAILFFALLLIFASMAFGELSMHQQERVIKDLGVVVVTFFGALLANYTGVSLLHKEIEKKTIYTIVSKPIERWHFLLGKYLGILMTMAVQLAVMSAIFLLLLQVRQIAIGTVILQSLLLIYVEVAVVAAFAMLFSSFSSPFLSGMMTGSVFLLGNLHDQIAAFARDADDALIRAVLFVAEIILPNLSLYNLSAQVTANVPVTAEFMGYATLHGAAYTATLLLLATVIFSRRDFI